MRRLDRNGAIEFVEITNAAPAACPIDRSELLKRFHASKDGHLLSGAAAFAAIWQALPLLRPLGVAARSRWVLFSLEWLYLAFLPIRPLLQRLFADR